MNRSKVPAMVVLVVSLLLAGLMAQPYAQGAWMRMNGAVVPTGTFDMSYPRQPARMVSVTGHRADGPPEHPRAAAYHVLVIFPADSVHDVRWGSTTNNVTMAVRNQWELWSGGRKTAQRAFGSDYDSVRRRVRIGGRRFALAKGNMFVVRYDEQGRYTVTQLHRTLFNADPIDVSHAYQALFPRDAVIQGLLRNPPAPCPKRAAPAPTATGNA